MLVVAAYWTVAEGKVDEVKALITEMVPHALSEPACEAYIVNQSTEDPRKFMLYEQYHDEAGFQAHQETQAFQDIVLGKIRPLLAERGRELYTVVAPEPPRGGTGARRRAGVRPGWGQPVISPLSLGVRPPLNRPRAALGRLQSHAEVVAG